MSLSTFFLKRADPIEEPAALDAIPFFFFCIHDNFCFFAGLLAPGFPDSESLSFSSSSSGSEPNSSSVIEIDKLCSSCSSTSTSSATSTSFAFFPSLCFSFVLDFGGLFAPAELVEGSGDASFTRDLGGCIKAFSMLVA